LKTTEIRLNIPDEKVGSSSQVLVKKSAILPPKVLVPGDGISWLGSEGSEIGTVCVQLYASNVASLRKRTSVQSFGRIVCSVHVGWQFGFGWWYHCTGQVEIDVKR